MNILIKAIFKLFALILCDKVDLIIAAKFTQFLTALILLEAQTTILHRGRGIGQTKFKLFRLKSEGIR